MMPAIQVYDALFDSYYHVCEEVGLISKYQKQTSEYDFELNADAIKDRFKIYVDTREQKPLKFNVKTEIKNLKFGDYAFSHPGYSQNCHIERKSVSDFVGTLSGGFDRFVYGKHFDNGINTHLGYRFGLISGYDERMAKIAEHTPVLPFIQLYNTWSYKHVGIELSWILDVISISLYLK